MVKFSEGGGGAYNFLPSVAKLLFVCKKVKYGLIDSLLKKAFTKTFLPNML